MDRGERAANFIESLTHTKGKWKGKPFRLQAWQRDYIRKLYGTIGPDGLRVYRVTSVWVPRKAGKTELAAACLLYALVGDGELGAEVYSTSSDRECAAVLFRMMATMVRADPYLSGRCKVLDATKTIVDRDTGSLYKALTSDAFRNNSYSASFVCCDEVHTYPSDELYNVLATSQGAREQPILMSISTAGYDRNSFAFRLYSHAKRVAADPSIDPSFLPLIFEASETDDPHDPATWRKAQPSLGVTVKEAYYETELKRAKEMPSYLDEVRRYYLNVWTAASESWLPQDKWRACHDESYSAFTLQGQTCFGGLDLASTTDLASLVLLFRDGETWRTLNYNWLPEDTAKKRQERDRAPYLSHAWKEHIELTPGDVIDYEYIRRRINHIATTYNLKELAVDRWNASQLMTQLQGDGINVVPFGQGFASMAAPSKEFEAAVMGGRMLYNSPVMGWAGSNVVAERDAADNIKPSKKRSTERIDPIVATIMALGRAIVTPENTGSVYQGRGLLTL